MKLSSTSSPPVALSGSHAAVHTTSWVTACSLHTQQGRQPRKRRPSCELLHGAFSHKATPPSQVKSPAGGLQCRNALMQAPALARNSPQLLRLMRSPVVRCLPPRFDSSATSKFSLMTAMNDTYSSRRTSSQR
ncbi:hypothetical protein PYCCODRAFT_554722 [Trametes coccinea BRFM310]|uniref:Uncharacterized protein n=1 Tax=Trametes coccinea (strain BRFM310) TaxID=1353009 RepID=A0A1Y2ILU5_TRAC3|nr:hypothetical protein PYCCODRAFT_554722 [Trametes coccinea BRFM310]